MDVIEIKNVRELPQRRMVQVVTIIPDLDNAIRIYQMRRGNPPETVYYLGGDRRHNYWMEGGMGPETGG